MFTLIEECFIQIRNKFLIQMKLISLYLFMSVNFRTPTVVRAKNKQNLKSKLNQRLIKVQINFLPCHTFLLSVHF